MGSHRIDSVALPYKLLVILEQLADRENMTVSALVTKAMTCYLRDHYAVDIPTDIGHPYVQDR